MDTTFTPYASAAFSSMSTFVPSKMSYKFLNLLDENTQPYFNKYVGSALNSHLLQDVNIIQDGADRIKKGKSFKDVTADFRLDGLVQMKKDHHKGKKKKI